MNPLSVFVTDVKCSALALEPRELTEAYEYLRKALDRPKSAREERRRSGLLADGDRLYLEGWFAIQTLEELDRIEAAVMRLPKGVLQSFYRVCLSNILRGVSWQKNDDLRGSAREDGAYSRRNHRSVPQ